MSDQVLHDRYPAVRAALLGAFGATELDAPAVPLPGGMSGAGLYRIRIGGIAYLLRLEPPHRPPFADAFRSHQCMRIAADLGLAPRVWHADADAGVVIMDLIVEEPQSEHLGGREGLLTELAQTVRLLHQAPPFPPLVDYLAGMDLPIAWFREAAIGSDAFDELVERFSRFRSIYSTPEADLVASHNDLNSRNVLFDGRRLWLIDWDAAFLADRYVDLAAMANWFARGPQEEQRLLQTYFGATPTPGQRARLMAMRQVNYLFYGLMFAVSAAEAGRAHSADPATARPLQALREDLFAGRLDLFHAPNRLAYGASLLATALEGFRSAAFPTSHELAA